MLTKTDFLIYLEAPMHLWAEKHSSLEQVAFSRYELHLMEQGKAIEKLAQEFLQNHILASPTPLELTFQRMVTDRHYQARLDALVFDPAAQAYDIYEIKSASTVKKEHLYDAAFQRLVAEANFTVRHIYLLFIDKQYTRNGPLQINEMFQIKNLDEETESLRHEILAGRQAAWQVASLESSKGVQGCFKPGNCPCPDLCHPALPPHSIFEIPRLHHTKARQLLSEGVAAIQDIPQEFPLSEKQKRHVQVARSGRPEINLPEIRAALSSLVYPLYFLDYESFNPAVPEYDGYRPYRHIVFQYSLHIFDTPDTEPIHHEFLSTGPSDPSRSLLMHLLKRIDTRGSVIVWSKAFEGGRNREMADRYPEFADRLENINARMFDLMEIFSKGYYVDAEFHGSASIKNVLPVLVNDLSYEGLPISKGDEAMMAWVDMIKGRLSPEEAEQTRKNLLHYCAQDTMAMVKIWQVLKQLV